MKKTITLLAAALLLAGSVAAQDQIKYQRSSLHLVLLTTDEPLVSNDPELPTLVENSWKSYPFPDKYNNHAIDFTTANAGKPKGGLMATVSKFWDYNTHQSKLPSTLEELKELKDALTGGKKYLNQLKENIDIQIEKNDVARKLVAKWYNIKPDGSWDFNLLQERAAFNMSASDVSVAAATVGGAQEIINQLADEMMNTTFVAFSKLDFYQNEAVAGVGRDVTIAIARYSGNDLVINAAVLAAQKTYEMMKDGYSALANTLLYKLEWNDSIQAEFFACFKNDGKIDMAKFNNVKFRMEFLGSDACASSSGAGANFLGAKKDKAELVQKTIIRNLDKQFVKLQKDYEVFRPVAPIICLDPLMADMGTKEGLSGGEKFEILTRTQDPKTGKMGYKSVGTVKVDKKGVWDNNYNLTDGSVVITPSPVQTPDGRNGTVLSKNKSAQYGMVVRQKK